MHKLTLILHMMAKKIFVLIPVDIFLALCLCGEEKAKSPKLKAGSRF